MTQTQMIEDMEDFMRDTYLILQKKVKTENLTIEETHLFQRSSDFLAKYTDGKNV